MVYMCVRADYFNGVVCRTSGRVYGTAACWSLEEWSHDMDAVHESGFASRRHLLTVMVGRRHIRTAAFSFMHSAAEILW